MHEPLIWILSLYFLTSEHARAHTHTVHIESGMVLFPIFSAEYKLTQQKQHGQTEMFNWSSTMTPRLLMTFKGLMVIEAMSMFVLWFIE